MKLLHTSDWHVGKAVRGRNRTEEHRAVFEEIILAAAENSVDIILVAGDLFETAAPNAESESLVYQTLLRLSEVAPVVVVSGNHDNGRRLKALAPLFKLGRITIATEPASPNDGGVIEIVTDSGEKAKVALLPFVSQRSIVKAQSLMENQAFENSQTYTQRLGQVLSLLCEEFDQDSVNLVLAHAFVTGAETGGGERAAHIVDEYGVSSLAFPATANYVALGHLHRAQVVPGQTAIHYCGSPLQMDFGESEQSKQVNIVEVSPGLPAKVKPVELMGGRAMVTLTGSLSAAAATARELPRKSWLRLQLDDPPRPGLADDARELIGESVVDVRSVAVSEARATQTRDLDSKSHRELFKTYLEELGIEEQALLQRFDELYDSAVVELEENSSIDVARVEGMKSAVESEAK